MLALVLLAAIGLGPESPRSLGPMPTPPNFEARIGDSVALAAPQLASVGRGVAVRGTRISAARPVSMSTGGAGAGGALAVAPAQVAGPGAPPSVPAAGNQPTPETQP